MYFWVLFQKYMTLIRDKVLQKLLNPTANKYVDILLFIKSKKKGITVAQVEDFWAKHPDQWKEVTTDASTPEKSMTMLSNWLKQYNQIFSIKWIARPANCDWMWLKCYYERYGPPDRPNIGYYCHDLSSLLRAYSLCYKIRDKKTWMNQLAQNLPYTHNALEDAIYQGTMYMNLRKLFDRNKM